ncbi:unnamed protein product, partial [marine sediment metagenome]
PEYWCGELGYRPGPDGIGYRDFPIHQTKVDYILSTKLRGKVVDIGCAMGYIVARLRKAGVDAWGVDVSRYALSHAPEEVKPYLKLASADSLPFHNKEFDMAVSFSAFEHLPPAMVAKAIAEVVRVANRGVISVTPGDDPHFDEDVTHQTKQFSRSMNSVEPAGALVDANHSSWGNHPRWFIISIKLSLSV